MSGFRIVLRMQSPIVMPRVAPRLDRCLQEASSRMHRDWDVMHELPLEADERTGFRGSQLILASTKDRPIQRAQLSCPDGTSQLDRVNVRNPPAAHKETGGHRPKRLTRHEAIWSPYGLFYGWGDGEHAAKLLGLLDGLGREHMRGAGSFKVLAVEADDREAWRLTATRRVSVSADDLPFKAVPGRERLTPHGPTEDVWRPSPILREVLF